jgi:hypothetical protein
MNNKVRVEVLGKLKECYELLKVEDYNIFEKYRTIPEDNYKKRGALTDSLQCNEITRLVLKALVRVDTIGIGGV